MSCDKCENLDFSLKDGVGECQNFKPKLHPLDELIMEMGKKYVMAVPEPIENVDKELRKLRYESIKWAMASWDYDEEAVNNDLIQEGYTDWIPK